MAIQRARMIAATITVVEEEGYARLTVAKIIRCAGVSRKAFYESFDDTEHCFLAAFEETLSRAGEVVRAAYDDGEGWRDSIRAALMVALAAMEQERGLARSCIVEALGAGERVLDRRMMALEMIADAIEQGGSEGSLYSPPPLAAQGIVGGIVELLHKRLIRNERAPLTDLLDPLMSLIVLPYLGRGAAHKELRASAAASCRGPASAPRVAAADPMSGLNMRVTYRTVRVLDAIGEVPGASNLEVAKLADIADRGQVSKLLRRLQGLGLIENQGDGQSRGAANSWFLTVSGDKIRQVSKVPRSS